MENLTKAPLVVLDAIRPFVELKSKLFVRVPTEKGYLKFEGTGICKDLYFTFIQHESKGTEFNMLIQICPYNKNFPGPKDTWISFKNLNATFDQWVKALESYHDHGIAFGNYARESKLEEEIYADFEPIEETKDDSISVNDLVRIDENLEQLKLWIEENKTAFLPVIYEAIKSEIQFTQQNLTESSKSELAKKVSKIFAKIMKNGPRFLKETAVETLKASVAEIVKAKLLGM